MIRSLTCAFVAILTAIASAGSMPERVLELSNGPGNGRNSEGDFATLADGRILFVYTHYDGDSGSDHASAHLASRISSDGGRTWSDQDQFVVGCAEALNVMSVSLVRFADNRLALFYLQKNSLHSCVPVVRFSTDEARSWSEPIKCLPPGRDGYFVLNNDRVLLTSKGRIVLPLCLHSYDENGKVDVSGMLVSSFSDDGGRTWHFGTEPFKTFAADGHRVVTQEPGAIELKDGRLMMWTRTCDGVQYVMYSENGGETWSPAQPWNLYSPCSPAQVVRLKNGDLLAVWNDHAGHPELRHGSTPSHAGYRTPMALAVSSDDGRTWHHRKLLEGSPWGWYCYFAVCETADALLIGYCAMNHLAWSRISRVPLDWLYGPGPDPKDVTTRRSAFPFDWCDETLPLMIPAPRGYYTIDGWCNFDAVPVNEKRDEALPVGAYRIAANTNAVNLFVSSPEGAFYGRRTLATLRKNASVANVRCFRLFDAPQYQKRGVKIDKACQNLTGDAIRRVIDLMADCKLNVLYWDAPEQDLRALNAFARDRHIEIRKTADALPQKNSVETVVIDPNMVRFDEHQLRLVLESAERLWTAPPVFNEKAFGKRAAAWIKARH